ncbi:MAG: tetratricopeptide repeat protein [Rhodospirillaceae bacterium]|nr:tetratricopeptide repeat protein [Rhodospirillaceae bacterium]
MARADDQNDREAQFTLGFMYLEGEGVLQNYQSAAKWFQRAAVNGDRKAQFNLGLSYETGRGVDKSYPLAAEWYRQAADGGQSRAQHNLGSMYFLGQGVPRDPVTAHMWLNLAAAQDHADASKMRDLIAQTMTTEQINEAQRRAADFAAGQSKN